MSARHRYGAAGLALLVLAVSACSGGGGEPGQTSSTTTPSSSSSSSGTTSPSSSPSSSTTATVDPADLPADARKHTPEGAAAFVKYYFEQVNHAWTTPSAALLPPLSDPGCVACKSLQATALQLDQDKQRYVSNPVTVTKVSPVGTSAPGVQLIRLAMKQHKVDVVDSAGKVVLTDPEKTLARTVGTLWKGESWLLYDME